MRQSNVATHLVVLNFLAMIAGMGALSESARAAAQKQELKIKDTELFCRADIGGASGIYEFLNDTVNKSDGICNVDKGVLPTNQAFVIEEVLVGYQTGDTFNAVGIVDYAKKLPAALRNAEFVITQTGREVVSIPVAALSNPGTASTESDNWYKLKSFAYLNDDQYFSWAFKFPKGASIAASAETTNGVHFGEVRLRGHKTERKTA